MKRCFIWGLSMFWPAIQQTVLAAEMTTYNSRTAFMSACRSLPGFRQSFDFANTYCLNYTDESELKLSGVSFWGSARAAGYVGLLDGAQLVVTFPQGARAFGADFSSLTAEYRSSFTASITLDSTTINFTGVTYPRSVFFGVIAHGGFTNVIYDDGGGIWRTNFNGQAVLANPLMVLNEIPPPVLTIQDAPHTGPGFTWSASNPGFAVQQSSSPAGPDWVIVSPRSSGCTDSWFLPAAPSELVFYRLVFVPGF